MNRPSSQGHLSILFIVALLASCGGRTDPLRSGGVGDPDAAVAADDVGAGEAGVGRDAGPGGVDVGGADMGRPDTGPCNDLFVRYRTFESFISETGNNAAEDFEREPAGPEVVQLPFQTRNGLSFTSDSDMLSLQILRNGLVDGSVAPHFRAFDGTLAVDLPGDRMTLAFRYRTNDDGWVAMIRGVSFDLEPGGPRTFLALESECGGLGRVEFVGPAGGQGGLSVDDFRWRTP